MGYNSTAFTITATTTETTLNLPSRTSSIFMKAPSTNTDFIDVRLGGGSPIRMNAGDSMTVDIENVCLGYLIRGEDVPPTVFITVLSTDANSVTQTLIVVPQEWRLA